MIDLPFDFFEKTILILGANGQMGAHLSEYFTGRDCKAVHGSIRKHSDYESERHRISNLQNIKLHYLELLDTNNVYRLIDKIKPDLIFNTICQSHVGISFQMPNYSIDISANGTLNVLEGVRLFSPSSRVLHYSTSDMFGNAITKVKDGILNEDSPMEPTSPYSCGKLAAHCLMKQYRSTYNVFASNLIAFNFESKYRSENALPAKVVKHAVEIKNGKRKELRLGNLDSERDWSDCRDTMDASIRILMADHPDDYVVASGETRSVREFCDIVFKKLGMNYQDYVVVDPEFFRPKEAFVLKGDASKIRRELGWRPKHNLESMVDSMIEYWDGKNGI